MWNQQNWQEFGLVTDDKLADIKKDDRFVYRYIPGGDVNHAAPVRRSYGGVIVFGAQK
jgi:hypothetical protein